LLKLGLCQQRTAALLAQPQARSDAISAARRTYERLLQEFGKHPLAPQAIYERARCLAFCR
jgi:TolA-binding protein